MSTSEPDLLLLSGAYLITSTTVDGALYGFAFAVYIFCVRGLYLQLEDRDRRRQTIFTLVYMSLLMTLTLIGLGVDARNMQTSYMDHPDYPDGGYGYSSYVFSSSRIGTMGYVAYSLSTFMISGIQIWRLWVTWRASRYRLLIVVLPALSLLLSIGLRVACLVKIAQSRLTYRLDLLFIYGGLIPPLYISFTVTVLIITRIVVVRRKHIKIMGQTDATNPYTSIISMLIESFALESVWLLILIIVGTRPSAGTRAAADFFNITQSFIQLLAYLLVVHRVTTGRAWKEDTEEKLTTLAWNRDGLQTTQIGTRASTTITQLDEAPTLRDEP